MRRAGEFLTTENNYYKIEVNNRDYPFVSVVKKSRHETNRLIWKFPFSYQDNDIVFCELITISRFAVISDKGRVKIYDIEAKAQIYHTTFYTHFDIRALISHDKKSLYLCVSNSDAHDQLVTITLDSFEITSTIELPYHLRTKSLYAMNNGTLIGYFKRVKSMESNQPDMSSQGIYTISPQTGDVKETILEQTHGDPDAVLPMINADRNLLILPSWKHPEPVTDSDGNAVYQTYLIFYDLQTLEPALTMASWAIPAKYLSHDKPDDIGVHECLKREPQDELYYEAASKLLSCVCQIFPAEDYSNAFWVQWGEILLKKYSFTGEEVSPYYVMARNDRRSFDELMQGQFPAFLADKVLYEEDGKIVAFVDFKGDYHSIDIASIDNHDTDQYVLKIQQTEARTADKFLSSDTVEDDFNKHKITLVDCEDLYDSETFHCALDIIVERTKNIELLRLDNHLVVALKDDNGYLKEEDELFDIAAQHPGGVKKIIRLIENVLAYQHFDELYYNDDTPAFMHGILALITHHPDRVDIALRYLERATHSNKNMIFAKLVPALIKAYQGTIHEEIVNEAIAKTGFTMADLPGIQIADSRVNSVLHADMWEYVESISGYSDPLYVLVQSDGEFLSLPHELPETDETYIYSFWVNDHTAFILCAFHSIQTAVEYFNALPETVPEFGKVKQMTMYRHNPIGCPFRTLEETSAAHSAAQSEYGLTSWIVYNDFTEGSSEDSSCDWPGVGGFLRWPREAITSQNEPERDQ